MRSRKKGKALFSSLTAMRSIGVVVGVVGIIALLSAVGCEIKLGPRPSALSFGQVEATGEAEATTVVQTIADAQCVNCHPQQPQTIAEKGAKHKTEVGCQDCHMEHPPLGASAVPACSMCHSDGAHYELENCGGCHTNTHAPLDIKLEGELTAPCLSCHAQQGQEVQDHPSAHTDLACNECHAEHRQIPVCMDCHEKHTGDMDFEACKSCHPVHMPLVIAYGPEIPSHYCGACHEDAMILLQANTTKHHDLACTACHPDKHTAIEQCTDCHGVPHPAGMLQKFPKCGDCHGTAHDLR